jgi:heme exporter protein D
MTWLDWLNIGCAAVFVLIAAMATFAPLAGFTKEVDDE